MKFEIEVFMTLSNPNRGADLTMMNPRIAIRNPI